MGFGKVGRELKSMAGIAFGSWQRSDQPFALIGRRLEEGRFRKLGPGRGIIRIELDCVAKQVGRR